ncbi:MAG: hypothetical protein AAFX39_14625 [Pseudomonadota bacterium]
MKTDRKGFEQTVEIVYVAALQRIHEYEQTAWLQDAEELGRHYPPYLGRQFVEHIDRCDDIAAFALERQMLTIGDRKRDLASAAQVPARLGDIGGG